MDRFQKIDQIVSEAREDRLHESFVKKLKNKIKQEESYVKMCEEKEKSLDEIDKIDIDFIELDVSARTVDGKIDLNKQLLNGPFRDIMRYVIHEVTHVFQQIDGDVEEGSADKSGDDYLDDENEGEAFSVQVDYMQDHYPDQDIIEYLEQLLDHHKIFNKRDRIERIRELTGEVNVEIKKIANFFKIEASIESDLIDRNPGLEKYITDFINRRGEKNYKKYLRWFVRELKRLDDKKTGAVKLYDYIVEFESNIQLLTNRDIFQYTFDTLRKEITAIKKYKQEARNKANEYFELLKSKREEYSKEMDLGEAKTKAYQDARHFLKNIKPKSFEKMVRKAIRSIIAEREKIRGGEEEARENADVLFEDDKFLLVRPKTTQSSNYFGSETQWCTAKTECENVFEHYFNSSIYMYYLINKKAEPSDSKRKIAYTVVKQKGGNNSWEIADANDSNIELHNVKMFIGDNYHNKVKYFIANDTKDKEYTNMDKYYQEMSFEEVKQGIAQTTDKGELYSLLITFMTENKNKDIVNYCNSKLYEQIKFDIEIGELGFPTRYLINPDYKLSLDFKYNELKETLIGKLIDKGDFRPICDVVHSLSYDLREKLAKKLFQEKDYKFFIWRLHEIYPQFEFPILKHLIDKALYPGLYFNPRFGFNKKYPHLEEKAAKLLAKYEYGLFLKYKLDEKYPELVTGEKPRPIRMDKERLNRKRMDKEWKRIQRFSKELTN